MHSRGQASKLWKTLKQAKLKLNLPNKPRSSKITLKTPGKLSTLNTAPRNYLPEGAPRNYPWEHTENEPRSIPPDTFKLQTIITQDESDGTKDRNWLHSASILDKSAFNERSNNKSPGPDGIVNELLRMLPTEIQKNKHVLFIIMWATGFTPKAWKFSNTILIDKNKGDETEASSYCPIGLANTLYINYGRGSSQTLSTNMQKQTPCSAPHKLVFAKDPIHQLKDVIMAL